MARKARKITDTELLGVVDAMIADAVNYDSGDRAPRREGALAYQDGRVPDLIAGKGKSEVVEEILADAMAWLLSALTRIFLASDKIAIYEPVPPRFTDLMSQEEFDAECKRVEEFAAQATDYINFVFLRECGGEKLLRDAIYNGLLHGNGIIKYWWDDTPQTVVESYSGIGDDDFVELVSDPDVEVLEHSERPDDVPAGSDALAGVAGPGALVSAGAPGQPGAGMGAPVAPVDPIAVAMAGGQAPPPMPVATGGLGAGGGVPLRNAEPLAGGGAVGGAGVDVPGIPGSPILGDLAAAISGIGGNFPPPPMLHDVKIRRTTSIGRLRAKAVADEDFLIESGATALNEEECRFCAHRDTPTRSDLIARGYDEDAVDKLGAANETLTEDIRHGRTWTGEDSYEDRAGERVEVFECYALIDRDGDGISEWHQIVVAGHSGARDILHMQEWGGRLPFADLVPDPVPHRWRGRSLYDRLRHPQRVATAFTRRINDNLYMTVEPQRAVDMTKIDNPDALFSPQLGGVIRVRGDARAAIQDLAVPFIAKEAVPMVEEQRRTAERRVGVGEQSSGLDADAISGQVATAVTATQSASALRKEDYARNIQIGVHRTFTGLLRLSVENQDRPRMMKGRQAWVRISPNAWSAEMDLTVNVGLGSGNRDRDLAMLQGVAAKQEQILQVLGPSNPLLTLKEYFTTLQMMVEAAGVKGPERFFPDVTDEMMQQMAQMAQEKGAAPDPKLAALQAKAQLDAQVAQAKMQFDMQSGQAKLQQQAAIAQAKLEADMRVREAEASHRMEMDRAKAAAQMQTIQLKAQAEAQLAQAEAEAKLQLERVQSDARIAIRERELMMEYELKRFQTASDINRQSATNLDMPQ